VFFPFTRHPLVSVIIPVRNGAHFLADAIASIKAQDYEPIEVVVVDDGSTDDVESALTGAALNLRYIRQALSGPSAARNRGIREAQGELIAFLDADDLWPPGNLLLLLAEMLNDRSCDVVHGYAQLLRHISDSGTYEFVGNPLEVFHDYLGGALYRRSAFEKVGLLDETLAYFEDVDWFYRARDEGLVVSRLPLVSLYVRRHEANLTHGDTQREFSFAALKKIMARKRRRAGQTGAGLANLP
jgi:glycosyltransferase involved in cell wall biosynthesis